MRALIFILFILSFSSCWLFESKPATHSYYKKVWGNKPVYSDFTAAKEISYTNSPSPVHKAGNICAIGNMIFQVEMGRGIHVIDNSIPAQAHRVGFIVVNGSTQVSVKDNNLYTNSYNDLAVIDVSDLSQVHLVKRVADAFPEGLSVYYLSEPEEPGYYECPVSDSAVIGWTKDSVMNYCKKD